MTDYRKACPDCGHTDKHDPQIGCLHWDADANVYCSCSLRGEDRAKDIALARVEAASDPVWVSLVEAIVDTLVTQQGPFTTDDVWAYLRDLGIQSPREPRAMGPVMQRAVKRGVIRPVGYAKSRRRHGGVVRIYEPIGGRAETEFRGAGDD